MYTYSTSPRALAPDTTGNRNNMARDKGCDDGRAEMKNKRTVARILDHGLCIRDDVGF